MDAVLWLRRGLALILLCQWQYLRFVHLVNVFATVLIGKLNETEFSILTLMFWFYDGLSREWKRILLVAQRSSIFLVFYYDSHNQNNFCKFLEIFEFFLGYWTQHLFTGHGKILSLYNQSDNLWLRNKIIISA